MDIMWVGMSRQHYQAGRPGPIRALVIHATAGRHPSDLAWLRRGGDEARPVSAHYYIDKAGRISQLVRDEDTAWHAGRSRWPIDGRATDGLNAVSLGIELENLNTGRDPYPEAQVAATVALTRELVRRYDIPRGQLVRHLDISPGRKTDPAGFPWRAFVAQVYEGSAPGDPPEAQLQALMLDLAYRAAGAALPAGWPLLAAARRMDLGMPVAAIGGAAASPAAGSAQDDRERAVRRDGQPPLLVEAYARDLIYAPAVGPGDEPAPQAQARRLAETPPGPLRDALLDMLFRAADPVNGFQPGWAFHRSYLERPGALGVPLGPSHRIALGERQAFACQHFALDTLCSPVGAWQTVYRLGDLAREVPGLDVPAAAALRRALLDDLYRVRAGRRYDRAALLVRHAEERRLGAPLGRPEVAVAGGVAHLLMPFALDVLACPLPALDWPLDRPLPAGTPILSFEELGRGELPRAVGRASHGLALRGVAGGEGELALLGAPSPQPSVLDLSPAAGRRRRRPRPAPEAVLIAEAPGPAALDLRNEAALGRWHYYIDTGGAVYRLCDEIYLGDAVRDGPLGERAIVVAVEGGPSAAGPAQRAALSWLVRALAATLRIPPAAVRALI